jgi:hypothetical protein
MRNSGGMSGMPQNANDDPLTYFNLSTLTLITGDF